MFNSFPILPFDDFAADVYGRKSDFSCWTNVTMDSANRYVRKIRGSQGGNDVSVLRCHLFPYCMLWRTCTDGGREGFEGAQWDFNRCSFISRSWHVLCAEFYTFCIYFKWRICVQRSFCQMKKGCTLLTRWLINTFHPKKIFAAFGVSLSAWNTRQSSW